MSNSQPVSHHRIQAYFPEDLYEALKERAKKDDVSIARIIRDAVEAKVGEEKVSKQIERDQAWEELFKLAGIIKSGPRDLSVNHDKYLADALWEDHLQTEKEYKKYQKRKQKAK